MKIHVLVEGQTEETFVKQLLAPHLIEFDKFIIPIIVNTKRVVDGANYKGGLTSYTKVSRDLVNLLRDKSATIVTTLFDFYGLPEDWPGFESMPRGDCFQRVSHLERTWAAEVRDARFVPFLMLHEFETFAFVDPALLSGPFPTRTRQIERLARISEKFGSPEEINEGKETAPSKRILAEISEYRKPIHGPLLCSKLGIGSLREACLHFDQWVSILEQS